MQSVIDIRDPDHCALDADRRRDLVLDPVAVEPLGDPSVARMSVATWILAPLIATLAFWTSFGACVDAPVADAAPQARVVATWDPLACGAPHRVVVELEDDGGGPLTASAPCVLGGLTLDVRHFGVWHGRIYAWILGAPPRSIAMIELAIDEPVVQWIVETPR